MKLTWLTDIHLNALSEAQCQAFYKKIKQQAAEAIIISGDIAEADSVANYLTAMAQVVKKPICFVLGNHDYYKSTTASVKTAMYQLTKNQPMLHYLSQDGEITLNDQTYLIGQDGWADGRYGDYFNSRLSLNDSRMIVDLFQAKCLGQQGLLAKMQELADRDASQLAKDLDLAIKQQAKKIIIVTHVPPFAQACRHQGKPADNEGLPYFASKISGDLIHQAALANTHIDFLVLCGHTHEASDVRIENNLQVKVGGAKMCKPELQTI